MGTASADANESVPPPDSGILMSAWKRRLDEAYLSLRLLLKSPMAAIGLVIVILYVGVALYVQLFVPNIGSMTSTVVRTDPFSSIPKSPFWWPGGGTGGYLGTSGVGFAYSLDTEIPKAVRTDLMYAVFVVILGAIVGTLIGIYSAYRGGLLDELLMRVTDVTYSIPFLVFAIAVAFAFNAGSNFIALVTVLLILWWPPYARLVRSQVLSIKELRFVEAARAAGASDGRIMMRHILPNTLAPVFVQISLDLGTVTQIFAALYFIGLPGLPSDTPELGNLIVIGYRNFPSYAWTVILPGLVLLIFTVGVNLLGDGLRDVLDPRLRR